MIVLTLAVSAPIAPLSGSDSLWTSPKKRYSLGVGRQMQYSCWQKVRQQEQYICTGFREKAAKALLCKACVWLHQKNHRYTQKTNACGWWMRGFL